MATVQEQYAELFKQGQDAALSALQTWNHSIQQAASHLPTGLPSAEQAIDQFYDFAGQILAWPPAPPPPTRCATR